VSGSVEPALQMCEDSQLDQCGGVVACRDKHPCLRHDISLLRQHIQVVWMLCRDA
jgi:hypothetical protein